MRKVLVTVLLLGAGVATFMFAPEFFDMAKTTLAIWVGYLGHVVSSARRRLPVLAGVLPPPSPAAPGPAELPWAFQAHGSDAHKAAVKGE